MLTFEVIIADSNITYKRHSSWHRLDGPACIFHKTKMVWYQYDKLHRKDGPACIIPNEEPKYWIRGKLC
jgi:hypothetical protein